MQVDPIQEWQRLTEQYRGMSDGELRELACDFANLTPPAQQALGSELRSRGLSDPQDESLVTTAADYETNGAIAPNPDPLLYGRADTFGESVDEQELLPDDSETGGLDGAQYDYTWKTPLCSCGSREEAWQIHETLRRAGIDSWVQRTGSTYYTSLEGGLAEGDIQIYVAADQLDRAQSIAAQPIPQEIVEESRAPAPEYEAPACPRCGATDPTLESVDPANLWLCESCGAEWTDDAPHQGSSNDFDEEI